MVSDRQSGATFEPASVLRAAIEREYAALCRGARLYVRRFGPPLTCEGLDEAAADILHEAIARALASAERYDPNRPAYSWLLGFVSNIVRERARARRRDQRHQVELAGSDDDDPADPLDRLLAAATRDEAPLFELLELVEAPDRELIRLAFVEDLDRAALARRLGIKEGAARVRLYRALGRLRAAYLRAMQGEQGR